MIKNRYNVNVFVFVRFFSSCQFGVQVQAEERKKTKTKKQQLCQSVKDDTKEKRFRLRDGVRTRPPWTSVYFSFCGATQTLKSTREKQKTNPQDDRTNS